MKYILFLIPCFLIIGSCQESKINEGEVTYDLTYPHMELDGLISVILPKEMSIVFKGTKMKTTISRGSFFETIIISDEANGSMIMYIDFDNKRMFCDLSKEELQVLKTSQPTYSFNSTSETDSLAGIWSKKYEVSSTDSIQPGDAWFTETFEIENGAWFSSYADVKGFPVVYDIERYGIFTHAEASNFNNNEVSDSVFMMPSNYERVDFKTYESEVQELFNILIDWD